MENNRFKELRRLNSQKRLKDELTFIDSRFFHSDITKISIDYQELVNVSEKHIVSNIKANGSRTDNVNYILSLFKISIKKYIEQNGDSEFKIIIPFEDYHFELSIYLNLMVDNYENIIETFFKIDNNTSKEILIYKEKGQAGLCLFREEYRYYISIW